MLCPRCHGKHVVVVNGAVLPCPECGGLGELHCCDGLQEQVCMFEDEGPQVINHGVTEDTEKDKSRATDERRSTQIKAGEKK